jgi:LysR family transcriptional activator of nhaA
MVYKEGTAAMERLNYHHLLYFWLVVREGSVTRASKVLRLAQPTLSAQIRQLEDMLGEKLFERTGRRLELTEMGRVVHGYADSIFTLGHELLETVRGRARGQARRFTVGVADVVPKHIARQLLAVALQGQEPTVLVVREARAEALAAQLALHDLDLVITDAPVDPRVRVKVFHHLLLECGIVLLAARRLAAKLRRGFPRSIHGAPFLMPGEHTALRRTIDEWCERHRVVPATRGEFDDSALLKEFGGGGEGVFAMPDAVEAVVRRQQGVERVGVMKGAKAHYYAVTIERRITHPAALAISRAARAAD